MLVSTNTWNTKNRPRLLSILLLFSLSISWFTLSLAFTTTPTIIENPRRTNTAITRTTAILSSASPITASATSSAIKTVSLPFTEYYTASSTLNAPVLFLHGLLGSKRNFASLAKSLGKQLQTQRTIYGVDLRNHGSHAPLHWQDDMSYPTMALDVQHFLQEQNINQVIIVAHSMGGKVAQALALLQPDLVQGLVVLDMAPVSYQTDEPHWKAVTNILHTLHSIPVIAGETTKSDVDKALRSAVPDPALRQFCLTNWNSKTNEWAIPIHKIVNELDTLAGFDLQQQSTTSTTLKYHGDTFFIYGGQSKFVRHAHVETIASYFPNHMLTTIRGAGHWVHAEAPDDTIALLKRYLDR